MFTATAVESRLWQASKRARVEGDPPRRRPRGFDSITRLLPRSGVSSSAMEHFPAADDSDLPGLKPFRLIGPNMQMKSAGDGHRGSGNVSLCPSTVVAALFARVFS